ncbi:hypothetical protein [Hymenobacter daeguensis]
MITQKENDWIQSIHANYIADVEAYKQALTGYGLPLVATAEALTTAYKAMLFTPLMAADKGLKARWDLTKTQAGQIALINATIDTDGHDEHDQLQASLNGLRTKYGYVLNNTYSVLNKATFEQFAEVYQLDLPRVINENTIDLSDKQDIITLFTDLAGTFGKLRNIFIASGNLHTNAGLHEVGDITAQMFENTDWSNYNPTVKDMAVWQLSNALNKAGKRDLIPKIKK